MAIKSDLSGITWNVTESLLEGIGNEVVAFASKVYGIVKEVPEAYDRLPSDLTNVENDYDKYSNGSGTSSRVVTDVGRLAGDYATVAAGGIAALGAVTATVGAVVVATGLAVPAVATATVATGVGLLAEGIPTAVFGLGVAGLGSATALSSTTTQDLINTFSSSDVATTGSNFLSAAAQYGQTLGHDIYELATTATLSPESLAGFSNAAIALNMATDNFSGALADVSTTDNVIVPASGEDILGAASQFNDQLTSAISQDLSGSPSSSIDLATLNSTLFGTNGVSLDEIMGATPVDISTEGGIPSALTSSSTEIANNDASGIVSGTVTIQVPADISSGTEPLTIPGQAISPSQEVASRCRQHPIPE